MIKIDYDAGVYLLEMLLQDVTLLSVGKLGEFELLPGYYYYVGSAQQHLISRLSRHLQSEKSLHWHIDYLLTQAEIMQIYTWPGEKEMECLVGEKLQTFPAFQQPIVGFGASDCKCKTHLLYFNYRPNLANLLHILKLETGIEGSKILD